MLEPSPPVERIHNRMITDISVSYTFVEDIVQTIQCLQDHPDKPELSYRAASFTAYHIPARDSDL